MSPRHATRLALLASALMLAVLTLGACTVGPNFEPPKPNVPATWSASASASSPSQPVLAEPADAAWWTSFNDPELTSLIARADEASLDLKQAAFRISEARAQRDVQAAAAYPSLNGNASWQGTRLSENTPTGKTFTSIGKGPGIPGFPNASFPNPYSQYQLGFDASWEIDLFGRVRRGIEAADADVSAAAEDSHDARLALMAEVARSYVDLRGAQLKRQVTEQSLATDRELLDLARQRRSAGLSSDIDVSRAAAQATAAEAQLPVLDRQIASDINQLSRLVDREPGALKAELSAAQPVPPTPPRVPVGLPSDLAHRRPDIRAAEARLHAATAQIGVAKADLYPRITLSANGGYQSESLTNLVDWASRFGTLGPQLEVPIFDAGRRRANVRVQDARAHEAAVTYASTVLGALHEADDALTTYDTEQTRRASLEATVDQNRVAADLALQRYKAGVASFLDVLDADRTLQQNQLTLADSTSSVSIDLVALYKALGGGWDVTLAQASNPTAATP